MSQKNPHQSADVLREDGPADGVPLRDPGATPTERETPRRGMLVRKQPRTRGCF